MLCIDNEDKLIYLCFNNKLIMYFLHDRKGKSAYCLHLKICTFTVTF